MERKTLKVLILIPNLNGGGVERMALLLATQLVRDEYTVTVFCHERPKIFFGLIDPSINIIFKNNSDYSCMQLPGLLLKTITLARGADLLIGENEGRASFLTVIAAIFLRKPIICWLHFNWVHFSRINSWRQRFSLHTYIYADRVIACSQGGQTHSSQW